MQMYDIVATGVLGLLVGFYGYLNYIQVLLYQVQVFHNGILTVD